MRPLPIFFFACLVLASCSGEAPSDADTGISDKAVTESPATPLQPSASPSPAKAEEFAEEEGDGSWTFEYSWPAKASAIAPLAARLLADRKRIYAETRGEWEAAQKDSPPDCVSCRSRSFGQEWKVVTDTPRFLSLSAERYVYTGGAHGMSGFDALLWDKRADRARDTLALFTSESAFVQAVRTGFCAALDRERAKRRGDFEMTVPEFNECIDPLEATIILGSSNGKAFNRIGFLIPPYAAGPYAEGSYEVTLPLAKPALAAVKPEYREYFSVMP
ncbi:MAG: DUF3298 and DUF4163 domain-containing protein [Hyphomonas sp.]|nr:DUF3298 and DUF4163 domain-containing protein [Hyphomonas sp.]